MTRLDRLARSVRDLLTIIERVRGKDASIEIGNLRRRHRQADVDRAGAIAAFEREMMLERQREGIAAAKAAGKVQGPSADRQAASRRGAAARR